MKHQDLIYDVGMHKGEDTDFYLKKGFRVLGFEADPQLVQLCREQFRDAISAKRLIIVQGGVVDDQSSGSAHVKFHRNLDNSVWGTIYDDWKTRNEALGTRTETIEVPTVNLRDCLRQYGIPRYMKIDIEGADRACLDALRHFDERPDYVSLESEKVDFAKLLGEIALLEGLGYRRFKAVQQSATRKQRVPAPALEGLDVNHVFSYGDSGLFGRELPGQWLDHADIVRKYRRIFWGYRAFGDRSILRRFSAGRALLRDVAKFFDQDIPGWFDTHAKHDSADEGEHQT